MDDPEFEPLEPDEAADDGLAPATDPVERLQDLVTYLVSNLVDHPDTVEFSAERPCQTVHLALRVPEDELGKVIGRQGRIARAIRTALMIAGSRYNVRATLDIEG